MMRRLVSFPDPTFHRAAAFSPDVHRLIDLAMSAQPFDIAVPRTILDLSQQLHGLGLVAWLARVLRRDDHFDLDGHDIAIGVYPPDSRDSLACNAHH
jgi:hypothetical protein